MKNINIHILSILLCGTPIVGLADTISEILATNANNMFSGCTDSACYINALVTSYTPTLDLLYANELSSINSAYNLTFQNNGTYIRSQNVSANGENPAVGYVGYYIDQTKQGNYSTYGSVGGALVNTSNIDTINADFINNTINFSLTSGGAIYNTGTISHIYGDFIENSANGSAGGQGGAIVNTGGVGIGDIYGNFIGNTSYSGGAIYSNVSTIDNIYGLFINNRTTSSANGHGGAIYNRNATINNLNGFFINNLALTNGGAIFNREGVITLSGVFVGNHANSGGAIYNMRESGDSIINLNNVVFCGNTATLGGAIYNSSSSIINISGIANFQTSSDTIYNLGIIRTDGTAESPTNIYLQSVSGSGAFVLNGYTNAYLLENQTISQNKFNISENSVLYTPTNGLDVSDVSNDGLISLTDGTLEQVLSSYGYGGNVEISGSVSGSADKIDIIATNNGFLTLTGGTLSNNITGSGQTIIDGTVINEALISQTMVVNSGKSLTTAASGLGANILNNGNVTLTGGTVNHNITGGGTVTIDGNVENNANLGLVIINENQSLTTAADSIYGISSNNGNLYLNGGTLGYGVRGNVYITGDVTNNAYQSEQIIISNGGMLITSANLLSNNIDIINAGTLNITSGNLQQNITGGNTIIGQGATTSATSFVNLELNGVMNVGTNTINMANADINGTINLGISSLNQNSSVYTGGHIIANDITFGDDAILNLTITDTNLQKGDSSGDIEIITANGEWTGDIATFTSNNLYDIAYNTENHTFTFTRKKFGADLITELNGTELDINIAGVWDELQSSDNPNIQTIINAIDYNSQHNATKYAKLIHNLAPQNHQVTVGAVRNTNTVIDNHIFTRLATLRRPQINRTNANLRKRRANPFYYYGNYRGRNGGDTEPTTNHGIWVEGLYNYAQQKDDTKFSGNTFGVMGGFDSKLTEHLTAGFGYAFNKTNIDADNHDIDAMGHTGFVYAEYKPTQWYLDALLSYNLTNYQNSSALIDNLTIESDYKTNSLSGALTSGYDFQKGLDLYGGLNYIGIKQDAYTDTAGQYIKADDTQMLTLKAGGRYKLTSQKMKRASTILKAAVLYDVMSDDGVTTVTVGNNNYIVHGNGIDPFGVQAGIMFDSFGGNTYLSLGYDLEWRNNFISHTGYIKLKYNF